MVAKVRNEERWRDVGVTKKVHKSTKRTPNDRIALILITFMLKSCLCSSATISQGIVIGETG